MKTPTEPMHSTGIHDANAFNPDSRLISCITGRITVPTIPFEFLLS